MVYIRQKTNITDFQGYMGSLPLQDGISHAGLPRSFLQPWQLWIKSFLQQTQHDLGEQWWDYYQQSPVYQFCLAPGLCGNTGWVGVLVPSYDQAGNAYPLTLVRSIQAPFNPLTALTSYQAWLNTAELTAMSGLQRLDALTDFETQLRALWLINPLTDAKTAVQQHNKPAWRMALQDPLDYAALLNAVLQHYCFSYSVWQTRGSTRVEPSLVVSQGLPATHTTSALLDGRWDERGWEKQLDFTTFIPALAV